MGAIGGMLGLGGGAPDPQQAQITPLSNSMQIDTSWAQNRSALQGQDALLQALQGQNGLQNQNQVYSQLQGIASGAVNPAQAQFNQNTAANVAQQGALMAGQRGAGANVGLMARQAGQQGGAIQQQAAGQAAIQQAQNQINAIGQAGNLANTMAGQQIGQVNQNTASQQSEQSNLLNALASQNSANVASQGSVNSANAAIKGQQIGGVGKLIGGIGNALGGSAGLFGGAKGGMDASIPEADTVSSPYVNSPGLPGLAGGGGYSSWAGTGNAAGPSAMASGGAVSGPQSMLGQYLSGMSKGGEANRDMVDVVVSPGEKIASPEAAQKIASGGKAEMKTVPGKAEVKGDSVKNDKVPTKLPAGTVVVKRSRANNNPEGFIKEVLAKRGKK